MKEQKVAENQENGLPLPHKVDRGGKYIAPLNKALLIFFQEAVRVSVKHPAQSIHFLRVVRNQQRSALLRSSWKEQGVHVSPIMILSITNRCNLHCQGCYHQALRHTSKPEISESELRSVIGQGEDLGVSFMVLAGGEPLVRDDIITIIQDHPDILFLMFTNGLLITDSLAARFKKQRNIVPLVSMEGYDQETDNRRGEGVYRTLLETIDRLKRNEVFFGVSITVTRSNFAVVTAPSFIENIARRGGKLILFAEYTPIKENTDEWVITEDQRLELSTLIEGFRKKHSTLFVNVPGDEKDFGGCLSAGRGFVHISAEGDLEPCPFAPYSDVNLRDKSLKDALQSPFLKTIREDDGHLEEGHGNCALWARREWMKTLLENQPDNKDL